MRNRTHDQPVWDHPATECPDGSDDCPFCGDSPSGDDYDDCEVDYSLPPSACGAHLQCSKLCIWLPLDDSSLEGDANATCSFSIQQIEKGSCRVIGVD